MVFLKWIPARRRNAEELEASQNPIRARLSHSHQFLLFLDRYLFHNLGVAKPYLPHFEHFINSPVSLYDGCDEVGGMGNSVAKRMFGVWMITEIILMPVWLQSMVRWSEGFRNSFNRIRFKKFKFKNMFYQLVLWIIHLLYLNFFCDAYNKRE